MGISAPHPSGISKEPKKSGTVGLYTYFCMRMTMLRILPARPAAPVTAVSTPEMEKCQADRSESSGNPHVLLMRPEILPLVHTSADPIDVTWPSSEPLPIIEMFMKSRTISISSWIFVWWKSMPEVSISLGMEGK